MANTPLDAVVVAGVSSRIFGIAEEVSPGKTPPNPELKHWRLAGPSTLSASTEMYRSNETSADRQGAAPRHGARTAAGDHPIEISPGSHAAGYEALLGGYWQTPSAIPIATVNLTATLTAAGLLEVTASSFDFIAAGLFVGTPVTFTGAHADVNGKKFIVTGHAANKITLLPPAGFTLAGSPQALTTGTFGMKGARVGMDAIMRTFVGEEAFVDIGKFQVFNRILFNTFSAELAPNGMATGTFGLLAKAASTMTSASIDGVTEVSLDDTDCGQLIFDAAAGTITRQTGSWIADGFEPGNKVQFTGDGITQVQNRQVRTVIARTATVLTVEEAIIDGTYTADYYVLKVGTPDYTAASAEKPLTSVSGALLVDGERAATVTSLSFSVDNQSAAPLVVGERDAPFASWGANCTVSVSATIFLTRGGAGEKLLNAAQNETDVQVVVSLDNDDGTGGMLFAFNRSVFAPGAFGTEGTGVTVSIEGEAAKPDPADPGLGKSKIYIYDTTITGVAPPAAPLSLAFVSEAAGGIATLRVTGGTAPYSFDADDGGATTDATVPIAGEFDFDYATNATYDPIITDAEGRTATVSVVIAAA